MRIGRLNDGSFVTPEHLNGRTAYCPKCGESLTVFTVRGLEFFKHVNAGGCDGSRKYLD